MPPMGMGYATVEGQVTDLLIDHYEQRARGGVGLVIVPRTCPGISKTNSMLSNSRLGVLMYPVRYKIELLCQLQDPLLKLISFLVITSSLQFNAKLTPHYWL